MGRRLEQGLESGVVLCMCDLRVWMFCVDGMSWYLYIVLCGHPVFNPIAPCRYLLPTVYLFMADIAKTDMFVCSCRTWICLDITRLYEEFCQPSSGSA